MPLASTPSVSTKTTENPSGGIFHLLHPGHFQSFQFRPTQVAIALALLIAALSAPQTAQGTALSDAKGSKASCIGIGPIVGKCIKIAEDAGLIKESEVGITGLTFA